MSFGIPPLVYPGYRGRVPEYKTAGVHEGLFYTPAPSPSWIPTVGKGEGTGIHVVAWQPEVAAVGKI